MIAKIPMPCLCPLDGAENMHLNTAPRQVEKEPQFGYRLATLRKLLCLMGLAVSVGLPNLQRELYISVAPIFQKKNCIFI